MRVLLDTHIALWAVVGSRRLAPAARAAILAADEVWVSVASIWEIAIKHGLGRGDMPISSAMALQAFQDAGYGLLAIRPEHALAVEGLALLHNDPFDRMLVAQALAEPLTLITRDALVASYSDVIMKVF
ncbi:MAG: type II toxin-antitoxin system VapC family toxin [Pseudomonadota bacterium]